MKKILMMLFVVGFSFSLAACEEETKVTCSDSEELVNGVCEEVNVCNDGYELIDDECSMIITENHVLIPSFFGMEYGDVLNWSFDNDVTLVPSSEFNDDVEPNTVFYQDIKGGEYILKGSEVAVRYSRGYDPNGEISLIDFTGMNQDEIKVWLKSNNIGNYAFNRTYDEAVAGGDFVKVVVKKIDERDENLRRDQYVFSYSAGNLVVEELDFSNPDSIRGVNLGGWFVLEGWMTPGLFSGVDGSDETAFMDQKTDAEAVLQNHWETFITEEDFQWLEDHGVEYVRLPIPWWYEGDSTVVDGKTIQYADSSDYIHQAMQWAETYNVKVLLDLHTAPGCQNGFDNGGIAGQLEWDTPENRALTVVILEKIAIEFSIYDSLWGIEVLNEPANWGINMNNLLDFYVDSYNVIRLHNTDVWIGFHDAFTGGNYSFWASFFLNQTFTNVFFDMHLYQTFGDGWGSYDIFDHLDHLNGENAATRYNGIIPAVIGEWSIGLQGNVYDGLNGESITRLKLAFANAQMNNYGEGMGWFFWNYKIDADSHLEWDFKRLVENEIFPDNFKTE